MLMALRFMRGAINVVKRIATIARRNTEMNVATAQEDPIPKAGLDSRTPVVLLHGTNLPNIYAVDACLVIMWIAHG